MPIFSAMERIAFTVASTAAPLSPASRAPPTATRSVSRLASALRSWDRRGACRRAAGGGSPGVAPRARVRHASGDA
jgi:hypothetical protein